MNVSTSQFSVASGGLPTTVHFLGNLLTFQARAAETDDRFTVILCRTAPGAGAPPHRQQDAEAFLVTEGRFAFLLDGAEQVVGSGGFVYVRPGTVHAFRNPDATPSTMQIINFPGGQHEAFFMAVGEPVATGTQAFPPPCAPDFASIAMAAERCGITLMAPVAG